MNKAFTYYFLLALIAILNQQSSNNCEASKLLLVGNNKAVEELEWWQQTVVYQIYPRSFMDSDGDGTGDLKGIQSKLDYLVELGIGAVWLSPIYKSPMADFGYDISNFTDIDPIFGTLDDFKALANEMHEKGIKVIMDFIPNHSSDQHPWFLNSIAKVEPYTDFYTWKDPAGFNATTPLPPNNWVSVFGGSMWEWVEERRQFYLHQFAVQQPDLRLENPLVMQEMLKAMEFWIELGVDGFRMDAVPHMYENQEFPDETPVENNPDPEMPEDEYAYWNHNETFNLPQVLVSLAQFRELLDNKTKIDNIQRAMMTEGYVQPLADLMKYYGSDETPIAHFPFNFELIGMKQVNSSLLKVAIDSWMEAMPEGAWANWLVGNHDNSRVATKFRPELVDAINMVVLLLPGTAVTYNGEEIGMEDTFLTYEQTVDPAGVNAGPDRYLLYSRDPERTPMQWDDSVNAGFSTANKTWLPLNPKYNVTNVFLQKEAEESHYKVYQQLAALRQTNEWKYGNLTTITHGTAFGFTRSYESSGFIVLANFGQQTSQTFNLTAIFPEIPVTTATLYTRSVGFKGPETIGSIVNLDQTLGLAPNQGYVLKWPTDGSGFAYRFQSSVLTTILASLALLMMR